MSELFGHAVVELDGIAPARLADVAALSSTVVAAAGAMGLSTDGPPLTRESASSTVVAVVSRDGHIVLHATPDRGHCLVDVAVRAPAPVGRGLEVIARRLGADAPLSPRPLG